MRRLAGLACRALAALRRLEHRCDGRDVPFALAACAAVLAMARWRLNGLLEALHQPGSPSFDLADIWDQAALNTWKAAAAGTSIDVAGVANAVVALDIALTAVLSALLAIAANGLRSALSARGPHDAAHRAQATTLSAAVVGSGVLAVVGGARGLAQALVVWHGPNPEWVIRGLAYATYLLFAGIVVPVGAGVVRLGQADPEGARGWLRTIAVLRVQVASCVFFGLLLLGPVTGPQVADVIQRWDPDWTDGLIAVALTALLSAVLFGTGCRLARRELKHRHPIAPGRLALLGIVTWGVAAVISGTLHQGESFLVAGATLLVLAGLSLPLKQLAVPAEGVGERRGVAVIPAALAAAPFVLLAVAIVRSVSGLLAAAGVASSPILTTAAVGAVAMTAASVAIFAAARRAPESTTWTHAIPWGAAACGGLVATAVLWNPWAAADLVGTVGAFATVVILMATVGSGVLSVENRVGPPTALILLGVRRLPVISFVAVAAIGGGRLDQVGDHGVRLTTFPADPEATDLSPRAAFDKWFQTYGTDASARAVPLVFVAAAGGGLRAAYWTDIALSCALDDARPKKCPGPDGVPDRVPEKARAVFAGSGVSGGALGIAEYVAELERRAGGGTPAGDWADYRLGDDYLGPTLAWMLFADLPKAITRIHLGGDRAAVLERAWEQSWSGGARLPHRGLPSRGELAAPLRRLALFDDRIPLPLLNATEVRDDCRINVSVVDGAVGVRPPRQSDCRTQRAFGPAPAPTAERATSAHARGWAFPATHDLVDALECKRGMRDVRLSTAALLSARFPYVAPTGRIPACEGSHDVELTAVDGGYIENSGSVAALDLWEYLRPAIEAHNASGRGACIVPVFLQIDNDYARDVGDTQPRPPTELLAPILTLLGVRAGHDANVRQSAAIAFGDPGFGSVDRVVGADGTQIQRYVQIYPRRSPDQQAPLGWALSAPSMEALRGNLGRNAGEIAMVRRWFDKGLRCIGR